MNQSQLAAFDISTLINTATGALKDSLPNLVNAGIQKRIAEINAKRAQKIAAATSTQASYLPTPAPTLPAPVATGTRGFFQNLPSWVIPALIALVVAFIKLRGGRNK